MPELPEVETIRRTLEPHLLGRELRDVQVFTPSVWRGETPPVTLVGDHIIGLRRRGKHLFLHFQAGQVLHVHLGMTGRLLYRDGHLDGYQDGDGGGEREEDSDRARKHLHLVFYLDRGELHYWDQRRFGYLEVVTLEAAARWPLGPEPLDPDFGPAVLRECLQSRKASVKSLLLDQRLLAGIGNIYADESLWRARVSPFRAGGDLTEDELRVLSQVLRQVLQEAVAGRGTTFSDYRDGDGRPGDFAASLRVYGKAGQPCPRCGTPLVRGKVAGRGTYFCPRCQR
ncbi:MAG TPA: bifunctional DNA-formamidopyrimidine glycosylase/DNA-(apurinic or apyrimidinic site) lyase [Firmicutes bacterium]|nr:bifunctional DNA-formamidopyrimidine glycosylase/DNA-(apurinic or apyrimidinic site) lyase [Bacillota bacterium]